jgi:hypothetical protein
MIDEREAGHVWSERRPQAEREEMYSVPFHEV